MNHGAGHGHLGARDTFLTAEGKPGCDLDNTHLNLTGTKARTVSNG